MLENYIQIFVDKEYPSFLDKYLKTKTLNRLQYVTQFCGCDYTKIYSPRFLYTRYSHSLVVAHMTWHFTHDKKESIAALLHDVGTPCFAHTIDYVLEDYVNQESSEKNIIEVIKQDEELLSYLKEDGILIEELKDLSIFPILENKSPKLCTDRLDGVLHTSFIWLHTHSLEEIKKVYEALVVLENEEGKKELGFLEEEKAILFLKMVFEYAIALQKCEDKYTMKYVSEIVKKAISNHFFTLEDLYQKKESEIVHIFEKNFSSWTSFCNATFVCRSKTKPENFFVSLDTKKRCVIPLLKQKNEVKRVIEVLEETKKIIVKIQMFHDAKYCFLDKIKEIG